MLSVTDFNAKGDCTTLDTKALQRAFDVAGKQKGKVVIPAGTYLTGTLFIRSNSVIEFMPGAKLLGSPDIKDYTKMTSGHNIDRQTYHLLVAKDVYNISILGKGTIDDYGKSWWIPQYTIPRWIMAEQKKVSPMVEITGCQDITIRDVLFTNPGGWTLHLHDTDRAVIDGIRIINNRFSPNADGKDITGCHNVMVSNSYIQTCDDAICLKTTLDSRTCERITVTNCIIETLCVGLKLGIESFQDMRDIVFSNCVVTKSSRLVELYAENGGVLENINISNITGNTNAPMVLNRPIHVSVLQKNPQRLTSRIKNVTIDNFTCDTNGRILLTAEKGYPIENLTLRDIKLTYPFIENPAVLAPTAKSTLLSPRNPAAREAQAAVVAENINNLVLDNIQITWTGKIIPQTWQHPERIENGSQRITRYRYETPRQTEFSAIWGRLLQGGYIFAPLAKASSSSKNTFDIKQSDIKLKE